MSSQKVVEFSFEFKITKYSLLGTLIIFGHMFCGLCSVMSKVAKEANVHMDLTLKN